MLFLITLFYLGALWFMFGGAAGKSGAETGRRVPGKRMARARFPGDGEQAISYLKEDVRGHDQSCPLDMLFAHASTCGGRDSQTKTFYGTWLSGCVGLSYPHEQIAKAEDVRDKFRFR